MQNNRRVVDLKQVEHEIKSIGIELGNQQGQLQKKIDAKNVTETDFIQNDQVLSRLNERIASQLQQLGDCKDLSQVIPSDHHLIEAVQAAEKEFRDNQRPYEKAKERVDNGNADGQDERRIRDHEALRQALEKAIQARDQSSQITLELAVANLQDLQRKLDQFKLNMAAAKNTVLPQLAKEQAEQTRQKNYAVETKGLSSKSKNYQMLKTAQQDLINELKNYKAASGVLTSKKNTTLADRLITALSANDVDGEEMRNALQAAEKQTTIKPMDGLTRTASIIKSAHAVFKENKGVGNRLGPILERAQQLVSSLEKTEKELNTFIQKANTLVAADKKNETKSELKHEVSDLLESKTRPRSHRLG